MKKQMIIAAASVFLLSGLATTATADHHMEKESMMEDSMTKKNKMMHEGINAGMHKKDKMKHDKKMMKEDGMMKKDKMMDDDMYGKDSMKHDGKMMKDHGMMKKIK